MPPAESSEAPAFRNLEATAKVRQGDIVVISHVRRAQTSVNVCSSVDTLTVAVRPIGAATARAHAVAAITSKPFALRTPSP